MSKNKTRFTRYANKLTKVHVNYRRREMKVNLAVQAVASESTSKTLTMLHYNKAKGFESTDVLITGMMI